MALERLMVKSFAEIEPLHRDRYLLAQAHVKGKIVIDAACGCGYGSCMLAGAGEAKRVHGWDRSQEAVVHAKTYFDRPNIVWDLRNLDDKTWDIPGGQVDVFISLETIEHLDTPIAETLVKMRNALVPGGILIFSHPANEHGRGNHYHKWFDLDPGWVLNVTKQAGFEILAQDIQRPITQKYPYHVVTARRS